MNLVIFTITAEIPDELIGNHTEACEACLSIMEDTIQRKGFDLYNSEIEEDFV